MPDVGRWFGSDPLAELAPDLTPYRFAFNNPVSFTDPTGMSEEGDYYDDSDREPDSVDPYFHFDTGHCDCNSFWEDLRNIGDWKIDFGLGYGGESGDGAYNDFAQDMAQENGSNDMMNDATPDPNPNQAGPGPRKGVYAQSKGTQVLPPSSSFWDMLNGRTWSDRGLTYNVGLDGKITGITPVTGDIPIGPAGEFNILKAFKSGLSLFKGGGLTNIGRAVTKHPQYFGFESTEALMKVFRSPSAINKLGATMIKDILRNGVKTTGAGGRYPDGWVTYTLPNGNAASWTMDGVFIGFRGLK